MKYSKIPRPLQKRLAKTLLLLLIIIIAALILGIGTHDIPTLIIGELVALVLGFMTYCKYADIKRGKYDIFDCVCIETNMSSGKRIFMSVAGRHTYVLQDDGITVELVTSGSLHLHKNQRYRLYLPRGSISQKSEEFIRLYTIFGFEMIRN